MKKKLVQKLVNVVIKLGLYGESSRYITWPWRKNCVCVQIFARTNVGFVTITHAPTVNSKCTWCDIRVTELHHCDRVSWSLYQCLEIDVNEQSCWQLLGCGGHMLTAPTNPVGPGPQSKSSNWHIKLYTNVTNLFCFYNSTLLWRYKQILINFLPIFDSGYLMQK